MAQELVPSAGSDAVSRELAEISHVNRSDPARYRRDEGMQRRRLELIDAQLAGSKTPPARAAGAQLAARKLELQAMMREGRKGRYWRSPELQAEYRALVEAELAGTGIAPARDGSGNVIARGDTRSTAASRPAQPAPKADAWRATPEQFKANAPELANRWGTETEWRLTAAQDNIFAVIKAVAQSAGVPVAVEMENSFNVLPPDAKRAVINEISLPAPSGIALAKQANAADVKRFASTPEGRECVARWGSRAPRNVAVVRSRIEHAMADMSAASRKDFRSWLDGISGQEAAAIYGLLVGAVIASAATASAIAPVSFS